jgi:hypothetical protein
MRRTGTARLPLHSGKAPRWLFARMVRLAREVVCHITEEYGPGEVLERLSDPYWFQAFGCVLGFDWHSSGVTTTTCGAVKEGIRNQDEDLGLFAAGGKGAASRRTPGEITRACERLSQAPDPLVYARRLSAKVDNSAVQDGHQLYHHSFFFTRDGQWCVVQQGMNDDNATARCYHWLGSRVESFVDEPHAAICCDARSPTLNLVAGESAQMRDAIAELAREPDRGVLGDLERLPDLVLPGRHQVQAADINPRYVKTAVKHDPLPCGQPSPEQGKIGGELRKAAGQCREKGVRDAWRPRWSGFTGKRRKRAPPPLGGRHLAGGIGRLYSSWSWKGWLRRARTRAGSSQGAAQD